MSYTEFKKLYLKAQKNKNAKYQCVVFDLVGSKKMTELERFDAQVKSIKTFNEMLKQLKVAEFLASKPILLDKKPVSVVKDISKPKNNILMYLNNPVILNGDCFVFYLYNNAISINELKSLFYLSAEKTGNKYEYNFAQANFETLDATKQNKKYWIGHVAQQLSNSKQQQIKNQEKEMTM